MECWSNEFFFPKLHYSITPLLHGSLMNAQQVADIFVEQRVLQPSQVEDVLQEAQLNGKSIEQAFIDSGFVDQRGFYQVIADALGTDFVELSEDDIAPEILR